MVKDEKAELSDFVGFEGDEDPDLVLVDGIWHLCVCRLDPDNFCSKSVRPGCRI